MLKRFTVLILCLSFALFVSTLSFSQDQPAATEEKKTEDMAGDEVVAKDAAAASAISALQAKTYYDGVTTYANSKVLFKLTTKDNVMAEKIEYRIDDGTLAVYQEPFAIDSEGKHIIAFFGTDKLGNKEDEKMFRITIDNTAPDIAVAASSPVLKIGDRLYSTKSVNFTVIAKDALSGVDSTQYSINGRDYADYVAPFNIINDGEVELKAKSIDRVSNLAEVFALKVIDDADGKEVELREASIKLFIDNIAPKVSITPDKELVRKDAKAIASMDYKYAVAAEDNESGVASILVRVDGKGDFMAYKEPISFATNGDHLIEAKAVDKMGNTSNSTILSVFVDIIPPQTTIETVTEK
ncbi:MAG TPA: hypothetical protein PL135_08920 [Spirochaetota bacterium]|nr:MAG: hypothetical protein BWY96_02481 [Spirochaetes bacterium ADurb.BinA120]HPI14724.1 hypothetical protein [Spirochaetota bacterium]